MSIYHGGQSTQNPSNEPLHPITSFFAQIIIAVTWFFTRIGLPIYLISEISRVFF